MHFWKILFSPNSKPDSFASIIAAYMKLCKTLNRQLTYPKLYTNILYTNKAEIKVDYISYIHKIYKIHIWYIYIIHKIYVYKIHNIQMTHIHIWYIRYIRYINKIYK